MDKIVKLRLNGTTQKSMAKNRTWKLRVLDLSVTHRWDLYIQECNKKRLFQKTQDLRKSKLVKVKKKKLLLLTVFTEVYLL